MLFLSLYLESRQVKHTFFSSLVARPASAPGLLWIPSSLLTNPSSLHSKLLLSFSPIVSHSVSSRSAFYSTSAHTSSGLWEEEHWESSAELLRAGQTDAGPFQKAYSCSPGAGRILCLFFFENECPCLISKSTPITAENL